MCEKIREGKVLSSPSDGDIDETYPKDWKPIKKTKKKKSSKTKICKTCNQDILANEMRDSFMFQDTYHQLRAKEYCKEHESKYNDHKCRPSWCGDCRYLIRYEIELQK